MPSEDRAIIAFVVVVGIIVVVGLGVAILLPYGWLGTHVT